MNTLGVRSAIGSTGRRKLSFRNVSNVVVQLLHTIKYSVPVPFSHITQPNSQYLGTSQNTALGLNDAFTRKVSVWRKTMHNILNLSSRILCSQFCRTKRQRNSSGHSRNVIQASIISQRIVWINSYRRRSKRAALIMRKQHMWIVSHCASVTVMSNEIIAKILIWAFRPNCVAVYCYWCWAPHFKCPYFHELLFYYYYFWPHSHGLHQF